MGETEESRREEEAEVQVEREEEVRMEEVPEEVEEGEPAVGVRQPRRPNRKEYLEHMSTHIPFRDWCEFCVKGQSREDQHRKVKEAEEEEQSGAVTTWSMDYTYITEEWELITEAKAETEEYGPKRKRTVMVSEDRKTGGITAHVVNCKGSADGWIVGRLVQDTEDFGYNGCQIRIKNDQEPAIMEVQRDVMARRTGITVPTNSPVGDSNANGE